MSATEAGNTESGTVFRARLQGFRSMDEFVAGFNRYVSANAILLPTSSPRDVGTTLHVQLEIASGELALACTGVVHNHKYGPDGRAVAMTLRVDAFEDGFRATFERMLDAKRERTGAHSAVPTASAPAETPAKTPPSAETPAFPLRSEPPASSAAPVGNDASLETNAPSASREAPIDASVSSPLSDEQRMDTVQDAPAREPAPAPAPARTAAAPAAARPAWLPPSAVAPPADESLEDDDVDALFDAFDATFDSIMAPSAETADEPEPFHPLGPQLGRMDDDSSPAEEASAPPARTMIGLKAIDLEEGIAAGRTMIGLPAMGLGSFAAPKSIDAIDEAMRTTPAPDVQTDSPASDSQPLAQLQFKKVSRTAIDGGGVAFDSATPSDIVERHTSRSDDDDADAPGAAASAGPIRPKTAAMLAALTDENPIVSDGDEPSPPFDLMDTDGVTDNEPSGLSALDAIVAESNPTLDVPAVPAPPIPPVTDLAVTTRPTGFFARIVAFFRGLFGGGR